MALWRAANPKTPKPKSTEPKAPEADETTRFIIDESDHSVVIVCKSCGWRCVELSVSEALYRLHSHSSRFDHRQDNYHSRVMARFKAYQVDVPADLEEAYAAAVSLRHSGPRKPFKPRKGPKAA